MGNRNSVISHKVQEEKVLVSSLREGLQGLWELLHKRQVWINCIIELVVVCYLFFLQVLLSGFPDSLGSYLIS